MSKRTVLPISEPVTLANMKLQLNIKDSVQDALITRRITEAREWVEEFMCRTINATTWMEVLDDWSDSIELYYPPITAITSVKYYDIDDVLQTLAADQYYLDSFSEPGILHRDPDAVWPDLVVGKKGRIQITYTAGYSSASFIPSAIIEAIMLTVGHWMNHQQEAESGMTITRVPLAVEQLLLPYRLVVMG